MKFQACVFVILAVCINSVVAHMGLEPPKAIAGERVIVTARIGHDCGDETVGTTNFTLVLPKFMPSVSVEQMSNWRIFITSENGTKKEMDDYYKQLTMPMGSTPEPDDDTMMPMMGSPEPEDDEMIEYVSSITYIGFLPDHFYQLFNIRIKMPELPGAVLWIKGFQDCHNQGTSIAWASIPSAEDPDPRYPARSVELVETAAELVEEEEVK